MIKIAEQAEFRSINAAYPSILRIPSRSVVAKRIPTHFLMPSGCRKVGIVTPFHSSSNSITTGEVRWLIVETDGSQGKGVMPK